MDKPVSMQKIDIAQRYDFIKELGAGGFGVVWLCARKSNRTLCAVKFVAKRAETPKKTWKKQEDSIVTEAKYLEFLGLQPEAEKYIIKFHGLFLGHNHPHGFKVRQAEPDTWYVLEMEYFVGHTLQELAVAYNRHEITPDELCTMTKHLVEAVRFIHRNRVVHRDMKPPNIMFDGNRLVLVDFGLACLVPSCKGLSGTPMFQAPEIHRCGGGVRCAIDWKAADVYGLGTTLKWITDHLHTTGVPEPIDELIRLTTLETPTERPSMNQINVDALCEGDTRTPSGNTDSDKVATTVILTPTEILTNPFDV